MFGYLLVSNKNSVVVIDGDSAFKTYLWKRVDTEIHIPMENASSSSSSGVFTDSTESLPPAKPLRKASSPFSMREVSHLFLPLISLYRSAGASNMDSLEMAVADNSRIRFKTLSNSFLLLCIGNNDKRQQDFLDYFQFGLDINLGPLLDLIDTDLLPVKNGKDNVNLLLSRHCKGVTRRTRGHIDVRRSAFYKSQTDNVFPLLKSVCSQLHLFIGSNRCLLMCKGDVLASVNSTSDEKQLWKQLSLPDLHCLLDQLESLPAAPMRGEISQMWLRSSAGVVPYYVNVIRCRLTEHLVMVCLSEAKHTVLIRMVVLLLMQLDDIQKSTNVARDVQEISKTVQEVTRNLQEMMNVSKDPHYTQADTAFLRNPSKTSQFLKSVWSRLSTELIRTADPTYDTSSAKGRFSITSLRSVFSTLSINTSIFSTLNNNGRMSKEIPLKLDVLLTYWRRQVVTLLQELCGLAQKEALQYKLALFQDSMRRIFRPTHEKMMYSLGLGSDEKEKTLESYLKPIHHGLDMVAFTFCNNEKHLSVNYIPDEVSLDLEDSPKPIDSSNYCADIKGKSGKVYTVYKIRTNSLRSSLPPSVESIIKTWWKPQEDHHSIPPGVTISVLFPSFVHKELAMKQIVKLSRHLHRTVLNASKLYL